MRLLFILLLVSKCAAVRKTRSRLDEGVLFSGSGTRTYLWECKTGKHVEWSLGVLNSLRPTLTVEVYKHGPGTPWDSMTGRITTISNTTATIESCPHNTVLLPYYLVSVHVVAHYGPQTCVPGTYEVRVTSSTPYAFVLGRFPTPMGSFRLTWDFNVLAYLIGLPMGVAAWASAVLFIFALRILSRTTIPVSTKTKPAYWHALRTIMFGSRKTGILWEAEEFLVVLAWVVNITADVGRAFEMIRPLKCDVSHQNAGSMYHPWNRWGTVVGIVLVRVGISVAGTIATLMAGIACRRSDKGVYSSFFGAVVVAVFSLWFGTGFFLAPFLTLIWTGHCLYTGMKK